MQAKPEYLDDLISRASQVAGGDSKLAALIEVPKQNLSAWKKGKKTCPVGDQTLMAKIAGLDANAWTARAVIAQYEGTEKGELLKQALKKAFVATGGVLLSSGADAHEFVAYLIRCILC